MTVVQLKEKIIQNVDEYVPVILEKLNCTNIRNYNREIRCSDFVHSSSNGIRIYKDTLYTTSYYDNFSGDVITLTMNLKSCSFKQAINYICQWLKIEDEITRQEITFPFGGYFKGIKSYNPNDDIALTYGEDILKQYLDIPNQRFLNDGISLDTQLKYDIRYDITSDRIIIPWRNSEGDVVGITGRYNDTTEYVKENNLPKYLSVIPFAKSNCLYGYYQNYSNMINSTVIIFEAEKSVLKCDSYSIYNTVAIGSHNVSEKQCMLITSLYPKNVIFAYDEDIEELVLKEECNKIIKNKLFNSNIRVGYIFDSEKKYLKEGSKNSPIDIDIEVFKRLLSECLIWGN